MHGADKSTDRNGSQDMQALLPSCCMGLSCPGHRRMLLMSVFAQGCTAAWDGEDAYVGADVCVCVSL